MKKLILCIGLAAFTFQGITAQELSTRKANAKAEKKVEKMESKLNLTPEQAQQVERMTQTMLMQKKEIKNSDLPEAEKKERMKALKKEKDMSMKNMLTDDQYSIYKKEMKMKKKKMKAKKKY